MKNKLHTVTNSIFIILQQREKIIQEANLLIEKNEIDADTFLRRVTYKNYVLVKDYLIYDGYNVSVELDQHELSQPTPEVNIERTPSPSPSVTSTDSAISIPSSDISDEIRKGLCVVCRGAPMEIVLCTCGHCLCSKCWSILVTQHKRKLAKQGNDFSDDNDDEYVPPTEIVSNNTQSTRQLRPNRPRIVNDLQLGDDTPSRNPPCPLCKQNVVCAQKVIMNL